MHLYETSATIAAAPETVWQVLTDGDAYTEWDSGITKLEGTIAADSTIRLYSEVSPNRAFRITIVEFEPPGRMVWVSGMPLGLFRGRRTFTLQPGDSGTRFAMREEFRGPLLPLIWRSMPDLQPSFDQFSAGLKARSEALEAGA